MCQRRLQTMSSYSLWIYPGRWQRTDLDNLARRLAIQQTGGIDRLVQLTDAVMSSHAQSKSGDGRCDLEQGQHTRWQYDGTERASLVARN